jgi:hypothetical protein
VTLHGRKAAVRQFNIPPYYGLNRFAVSVSSSFLSEWLERTNHAQKDRSNQKHHGGYNQTNDAADKTANCEIHTKRIVGDETNNRADYRKNQKHNPAGYPKNLDEPLHVKRAMLPNRPCSLAPRQ